MVLKASEKEFKEAFVWLSSSISMVTNSIGESAVQPPQMPPMIEIL